MAYSPNTQNFRIFPFYRIVAMLMNLLLGLPLIVLNLLLQSLLLVVVIRYYSRHHYLINSPSLLASLIVVNGVLLILIAGNLGQVALWAFLFQYLGEFAVFEDAFYHSAVNFATLGYGDIVMSDGYKLLGAIEAINGVLMIGVSTAVLMATFNDAFRKTRRARMKKGLPPI